MFATMKKFIKLGGFNFGKNGPPRLENCAKVFKKCKMAKNVFFKGRFGFLRLVFGG